MIDLNVTFFIQLVNFLITLVVLNWLLVRPIRDVIKKRTETMSGLANEAQDFSAKARGKLDGYEEALAQARRKAAEERDSVKLAAQQEEKTIVDGAQQEAQTQLAQARQEIESQSQGALEALKAKVEPMAEQAAAKILG